MNYPNCAGCACTILTGSYVALDRSKWCQSCYRAAQQQVHENYAPEEELAVVDRHALVLGVLRDRQDGLW